MNSGADCWEGSALKDLNLAQLRLAYDKGEIRYEELLELLRTDTRKGLIQLIETIRKQRQRDKAMIEQYQQMMAKENDLHRQGLLFVAGLDEVGRGGGGGGAVCGGGFH